MPNWVIEGVLAISPRPGFTPGEEFIVPPETVEAWLDDVRGFGISSVLCLLDEDQLWLYRFGLPQGLLGRYLEAGLSVGHVPTPDQKTVPFTPEQYDYAWSLFQELPKPILVHCSAGHDRTGRVVRMILERMTAE